MLVISLLFILFLGPPTLFFCLVMRLKFVLFLLATCATVCYAEVTIYRLPGQVVMGPAATQGTATSTATGAAATYTGAAAYDPTVLDPPALPDPRPATQFDIKLSNNEPSGLSIPQKGDFMGFSIEFSVVANVCESGFLR